MLRYGHWMTESSAIPWVDDPVFSGLYERAYKAGMQTPMVRCFTLYALAKHTAKIRGAAAECGVFRGGTASIIGGAIQGNKKLYLFDTFCGIPSGTPKKDNRYIKGGEFCTTSVEVVKAFVQPVVADLDLRAGRIPESFSGLEAEIFSFVHLDLDIYQSTLDALAFFYPRMQAGGVIVYDDYGSPECEGARLAVDEFSETIKAPAVALGTGQAITIKG